MDNIKSAIDMVKDVGPTVWKYVKYQFCPNDYVDQFIAGQNKLKRQLEDVEAQLNTQHNRPAKKARSQVDNWLEEARKETTVNVEDLICKEGYFKNICSSRKFHKKIQALNGIFMEGGNYTNAGQSLVIDDHSIEYRTTVFKEKQEQLKLRQKDIKAQLETQCMQPGKIARKEVEDWMEKAGQRIAIKVQDLISRGECSSSSILEKKTEELKQTFEQGEKYTNASESLVVDDHSIDYYAPVYKEKQERLKHQKEHIEANLKTQCMQPGKNARKEVEEWLEKADQQIAITVEDLISQGQSSSSTNLRKNIEELKQRLEEGKEFTNASVSLVIDDHSIKGVPLLVEKCSGRDDIQDQILEWLKGDEVTRIAVSGMGGVGKTTIMKQVHNQLLKESKFNKVVWVKVSKDFDIIVQHKKKFDILKFQKRIASSLELKLELQDHENETKLAGLITQRLGQGSSVLILDDVWEPFSLDDVGIPDLVGNNGCKLVLTTRLRHVARAMDCKVILVNPLPANEALALFLGNVGSDVFSNGKIKTDIEPFLKQILQKCDGVPLAIVTVAKSMRGKLNPSSWKLALSELMSKFEGIVDCLKFSYECLKPQCQECFLYCAMYPEDYEIPKEHLIEYWIEEGFIYKEGKTREVMNWKGHDILDMLVDNCLLESIKSIDEEDCVSMHDLLREMALEIRPQFLVKAGMALEKLPEEHEWSEDLLKVSLMRNYITEIPSSMPSPKCPMLTTFLLSNNKISTIPEAFFEHMLGLKILDLSYNRQLSRLPSSVSKLEKLTALLLNCCASLREVPSLSSLVGLKKLDISWTSIEELPQGLNMLTNLKYLGLGGRLSETLDELLQNLSKLQHLTVKTSTKFKWEKIGSWGKLQNLEKLNLYNLNNLNAVFGDVGAVAKSTLLPVGTFSSLLYINLFGCDKIKKLFSARWLGYLQKLQTIHVRYCLQLEEIIESESEEGEKVTLPKLESLRLNSLPQLKRIYSNSNTVLICDSLKNIEIESCKNIESVFWSGFSPLPNLEYLHLYNLVNLKSMFNEEGLGLSPLSPPTIFFSLKEIEVYGCNQLKKVFSSGWLLGYFQSLETIRVGWCSQMEELISSLAHEEENVTLQKLQSLELIQLPALNSIYTHSSVLICDSIQSLRIANCEKLKRIPLNFHLLDNAHLSHPPSLKQIVVFPKKWWASLEWNHPNAKDILLPLCEFRWIDWFS
ncbi:hypothetical protein SLE2022_136330 [Rubroshorea leprosula]